jgi:hypothetical protein
MTQEQELQEIEERWKKSTPTPETKLIRYENGGGRMFKDLTDEAPRKLVADFYEEPDREFYAHAWADVRRLLELVRQQGQGWIPVSERLPKKFEQVLVNLRPIAEGPGWYPRSSYFLAWQKRGIWFGAFVDPLSGELKSGEIPEEEITHWQPLSAPPNRGKKVAERTGVARRARSNRGRRNAREST